MAEWGPGGGRATVGLKDLLYDGLIVILRAEQSCRPVSNSEVKQLGRDVLSFKTLIHQHWSYS